LEGAPDGAVIIRVRIDPAGVQLFPDEDYLRYLLEHPESDAVQEVAKSIGDVRHASIDPTESLWQELGFTWERSFTEYGSVATPHVDVGWLVGFHQILSWEEFGIFAEEDYLKRPFPIKICYHAEAFKDELERRSYNAISDAASRAYNRCRPATGGFR
jgi:hypothetical protein